ncbi:MAG: hypothetical protein WCT77_00350 [Bacteroidota bacterium]
MKIEILKKGQPNLVLKFDYFNALSKVAVFGSYEDGKLINDRVTVHLNDSQINEINKTAVQILLRDELKDFEIIN